MFLIPVTLLLSPQAAARVLDPDASPKSPSFEAALDAAGIDVQRSWESGSLADAAVRVAPLDGRNHGGPTERLGLGWVESAQAGHVRVLAAYLPDVSDGDPDFQSGWATAPVADRVILTHTAEDAPLAQRIRNRLDRAGYATAAFGNHADDASPAGPAEIGAFYAEAGSRWALSTSAETPRGLWMESKLLASLAPGSSFPFHESGYDHGELTAVNSRLDIQATSLPIRAADLVGVSSLFHAIPGAAETGPRMSAVPGAASTPLHMSALPGAAEASFFRLPGGIVLGQMPDVSGLPAAVTPKLSGGDDAGILRLGGHQWRIDGFDPASRAACVAFASDAVDQAAVDMTWVRRDGERHSSVYAHPALRSSALGEILLWSDQMPYAYLSADLNHRSDRSVIVDRAVRIRPGLDGALAFDVDFDVRFYKRGAGDVAEVIDTRRYTASSETGFAPSAYIDVPGVEGGQRILVADAQDHGLAQDLGPFARAAAWVSLSRWVLAEGGRVE